ncbi:AraC family transcriptional regulator [Flavobacteriaceae bacterium CRH]|nr:AraC family transcriptional regulator [Flavobacteriaceae bacterium CRH]
MHQEFESPQELRDTIKCFWYDRIEFGEQESAFEVVPDSYAEIIFHFGNTCSISYNGDLQALPSPFMIGLLNQPVHFFSKNNLQIIGIRCFPWTVFDLLGLESGKGGVQEFEHPLAQLQPKLDKLIQSGNIEEAIAEVKQYFLNTHSQIPNNSTLLKAGSAMRETNGSMPVSEVADAAHATIRTLERKFKQSSGYTVKDVSALIRFEQVRNELLLNPNANLASLAHDLGYTDQSHLSREFKRYSGTTPSAFARNSKKQIISDNFIAFVQRNNDSES